MDPWERRAHGSRGSGRASTERGALRLYDATRVAPSGLPGSSARDRSCWTSARLGLDVSTTLRLWLALAAVVAAAGCKRSGAGGITGGADALLVAGKPSRDARVGDEVTFEATLRGIPAGSSLALSCSWRDPSGREVRDNQWSSGLIQTPTWKARCRFIPDSPTAGEWSVVLSHAGRPLSRETFTVAQ